MTRRLSKVQTLAVMCVVLGCGVPVAFKQARPLHVSPQIITAAPVTTPVTSIVFTNPISVIIEFT